jgi:uncharacterized protein (TIGR03437 family)
MTTTGALLKIDTSTSPANVTQLIASYPLNSFLGGGAPGSIVVAGDFNLPFPSAVGTPPYSTELAGIAVTVEHHAAPVLLVSPAEIEFQIPWEAAVSPPASGSPPFPRPEPMGPDAVMPGAGPLFEAAFPITILSSWPAILPLAPVEVRGPLPGYVPIAVHQDGTRLVTYDQPAAPGEIVTMYGTGFGAVSPAQADGVPAALNPLALVTPPITISGGSAPNNVLITPSYLGLAPGFVGLYQLNFQIPSDLPVSTSNIMLQISSLSVQLPLAVPAN